MLKKRIFTRFKQPKLLVAFNHRLNPTIIKYLIQFVQILFCRMRDFGKKKATRRNQKNQEYTVGRRAIRPPLPPAR
jgi:hypothetical protein